MLKVQLKVLGKEIIKNDQLQRYCMPNLIPYIPTQLCHPNINTRVQLVSWTKANKYSLTEGKR